MSEIIPNFAPRNLKQTTMEMSQSAIRELADFLSENTHHISELRDHYVEMMGEDTDLNGLADYALCNLNLEPCKSIVTEFLTN